MSYEPRSYWHEQHQRDDLSAVGQAGYSASWNEWLYRSWLVTGLEFLRSRQIEAQTVCDVGAGRGSWFDVWRAIGAEHVTVTDLVPDAVDHLSADAKRVMDITRPGAAEMLGSFDLVAAMYVLLHVVEGDPFDVACANLAAMVRPGGHLLLAEPIAVRRAPRTPRPGATSRARPLEAYKFDGLSLVALRAATVVGGDPIESPKWLRIVERARWGLTARAGSRMPRIVGPLVLYVDQWLLRHTNWMPSAKLALYRRDT